MFFKKTKKPKQKPVSSVISFKGLEITLTRKPIRNLHLKVLAPDGKITLSAPHRMNLSEITSFLSQKWDWIEVNQKKILSRLSHTLSHEYTEGETHFLFGQAHTLKVVSSLKRPRVDREESFIVLHVSEDQTKEKRKALLEQWYRKELKSLVLVLIKKYEPIMGVEVKEVGIKKMKTRWGTCNPKEQRIWFNLELVTKKYEHVEYIVVHEMVHLLERSHNHRFKRLMDKYRPLWREHKKALNNMG